MNDAGSKNRSSSIKPARPTYSVVLPTLNGRRALQVTLGAMLSIDRDDVEWLISDNHSDDGTSQWLLDNFGSDPRLRVIQPPRRLPLGKHLEFALRQARGQWITHLGDDDLVVPWRFDVLDGLIARFQPQIIRGQFVRYLWPNFPDAALANTLDRNQYFSGNSRVVNGKMVARELLNRKVIHAGGAWTVHRSIVRSVRERCGWYASPQHVEFFAIRSAAVHADRIVQSEMPLMILGRHQKSSGTKAYMPRRIIRGVDWDWDFEDPDRYAESPFQWKSYATLSLDAALCVRKHYAEELSSARIDWPYWAAEVFDELLRLRRRGQLPVATEEDFFESIARLPIRGSAYWRVRKWRVNAGHFARVIEAPLKRIRDRIVKREESVVQETARWGWKNRIHGCLAGFDSIQQLPDWLSHRFAVNDLQSRDRLAA